MIGNVNRDWFLKLKKLGLTLSYCMTCLSFAGGITNISVGKTVKVSENARTSIISDNLGFNDSLELDYITRVYEDENGFYITEYDKNKTNELVDKNINTSSLKDVSILRIDGSCCGDLSFLEISKNIEFMVIKNFNCLTEENLDYISKLPNLNKLYISISIDYLLKNPNYKLDLSKLEHVENIYLFPCSSSYKADINNLLIYNIGAYYYNTTRSNIFDNYMDSDLLKKVETWDLKFDEMLKKIPISCDTPDEEKIMQIVYFVNDYYKYDDKVSEYLDTGVESTTVDNLVLYYNVNLIDPIFKENREGVCSNFATFTNILCYKAGLESYYISGYCKDLEGNDVGHAWNLVNVNDNYYIVDTTVLENNMDYIVFSKLERNSKKTSNWYGAVLAEILIELGGGLASYYTDPYDYTDSIVNQDNIEKVSDDVVYFNEDNSKTVIDVKYKERFKEEIKMFVISTLVSLGFAYSISKDKVKMKKMWEE